MISIPPYFLLIPYGVVLAVFAFFALANVVSLAKYGARNWVGFLATFVFVCGTAVIGFFTWQALSAVDWTAPLPLFSASSSNVF